MYTPVCLACWHLLNTSGKAGEEEKKATCDHHGYTNNIFHLDCLSNSGICVFVHFLFGSKPRSLFLHIFGALDEA